MIKKTFFILFTICVLAFEVAQVFGSTIELIPVADGSRVYRRECQCVGPPCYPPMDCLSQIYFSDDISVYCYYWVVDDDFYYYEKNYSDNGIMEFDISSLSGLFIPGQIQVTLILTVEYVSNPLTNNGILLFDITDNNENGIIDYNDAYTSVSTGSTSLTNQAQPGDTIEFDVTRAVEHDLFESAQTAYSGFVLKSEFCGPSYNFYNHTSAEHSPKLVISGSTLIGLSSLTATPGVERIIIAWSTASEIDTVGFNLYRAEAEAGKYIKINSSLIPAQGSATKGTSYESIDTNVQNRKTYYYKLEDINTKGISTFHGTVKAVPRWWYGMSK